MFLRNLKLQLAFGSKKTIQVPLEIKAPELYPQTRLPRKIVDLGGRVYLGTKSGISRALFRKIQQADRVFAEGGDVAAVLLELNSTEATYYRRQNHTTAA